MRKFRRPDDGVMVQRVLVLMILDMSGSMTDKRKDIIGGYNTYIDELKKDKETEYFISTAVFADRVTTLGQSVPIGSMEPMTDVIYRPMGGTALLDAIGELISKTDTETVTKVITVIMTDGEENASRTWSYEKTTSLISDKEKEGNWTFVFLGETLDAAKNARPIMAASASVGNTYTYNYAAPAASISSIASRTVRYARSDSMMSKNLVKDFGTTLSETSNLTAVEDEDTPDQK